jgi:O-acetyl-ADP-ribose deacetylase (regulator of RNase III)
MRYFFVYRNEKLGNAWKKEFANSRNIEIFQGDITKIDCDAIVSPANSFGFMDGGLDYSISDRFGWDLQEKLQYQIKQLPEGELLVGRALVIETGDDQIPYLISAPTMRVPMSFNIST